MDEPERLTTAELARLLRLSVRTIQLMAAAGEIPGAAQFRERPGSRWTFDAAAVHRWIRRREARRRRRISAGGAASGIDEAYARALNLKPTKG